MITCSKINKFYVTNGQTNTIYRDLSWSVQSGSSVSIM